LCAERVIVHAARHDSAGSRQSKVAHWNIYQKRQLRNKEEIFLFNYGAVGISMGPAKMPRDRQFAASDRCNNGSGLSLSCAASN